MNNIVFNFNQILEFAKNSNVPIDKKRGIIREYLQSKFISYLYTLPKSNKISFVGGTSLRLIRGLNRFSEDLDFDNLGLTDAEVKILISEVARKFESENIRIELKDNTKENKTYFEFSFPDLLVNLNISTDPREKLMIKFDYSSLWKKQKTEVVLFNKYGFIENVVTNTLGNLLVQKLTAYLNRKVTQPRDIYDIIWLFSNGAKIDQDFVKDNSLGDLLNKVIEKYKDEGIPDSFKNKLSPFLFDENDTRKLQFFESVILSLRKI